MRKMHALALVPLIGAAMVAAGCGQKVTVKTANGDVAGTIDAGRNSANLNINGSTLATGDKVSLPSDFPTDVYVIPGTIKTAVSTPNASTTVAMTTTSTMAEANALYKSHLTSSGWTISTSGVIDAHSAAIIATKDTRSLTVSISDVTPPTIVQITVMFGSDRNLSAPQ